jgi:hypothetical protein
VHREIRCTQDWPSRWGFLSDEYSKLSYELATLQELNGRDSRLTPKKPTESVRLPPISVRPCLIGSAPETDRYPPTSQKQIGWKHANLLDIYGKYARGKFSIEKQLKWPRDGFA